MISRVLQPIKFVAIGVMLTSYLLTGVVIALLSRDKWKRTKRLNKMIQFYAKIGLFIIGIKVEIKGEAPDSNKNYFLVSNHLSYLDILVHSYCHAACFVTSQEVRDMPVLGQLCILGGCLFIERRSKNNIKAEISQLTVGLEANLSLTIYPEATSTNGDNVLRFRRPLYNAALFSNTPVKPMTLNYLTINGEPVNRNNRDLICWYDKMSFVPHLWAVLGSKGITARVTYHSDIEVNEQTPLVELVAQTYNLVSDQFISLDRD